MTMEPSVSFVTQSMEASLQCVLKYLNDGENSRSFQITLGVEENQECVVLADLLKNGSLKCIKSVGTVLDSIQDTCNRCSHPAMGRKGEIHLSFSLEDIACDTCEHQDKKSEGAMLSDSSDSRTHHTRRRRSGGRYCCPVCKEVFVAPAYLRKHVLERTCCSAKEEVRTSDTSKSIGSTNPLLVSSARADIKMEAKESTDTYKCDVCAKTFSRHSRLKEHKLTHLPRSQFAHKCIGCGKSFKRIGHLHEHIRYYCNPKDDHVLEDQDSDVVLHEAASTSHDEAVTQKTDLEYKCGLCNKMFARRASLLCHLKTHQPGVTDEADEIKSESGPRIEEVGGDACKGEEVPGLPCQSAPIHKANPKSNGSLLDEILSEINTFKIRKRRHIKGVGYKCDVCEKPFEFHSSLRDHKKSHLLPEECPHKCKVCGRVFRKSSNLKEHMLVHLKDSVRRDRKKYNDMTKSLNSEAEKCIMDTRKFQIFSCPDCSMGFRTKFKLKFHIMTHLPQHMYSCKECVKSFLNVKKLEEHCLSHMSSRGLTCSLCSEEASFSSSWDLYKHMKTHWEENRLLCRSCNTEFESPELLAEHHCEVEFFCDICGEDFPNQIVGVEHAGYHDEFECKVCVKVLPSVWKLDRHMAMHADGKHESSRDDCGKTPNTGSTQQHKRPSVWKLNRVTMTHTDGKPQSTPDDRGKTGSIQQDKLTNTETKTFECDICTSSFRYLNNLENHRRLIHTIQGSQNPFQCHFCGKKMSTQQFFDKHLESKCTFNEDEKQKCKICGLMAFNSVRLEKHMRIHADGVQPFICELCGKGFYSKSSLRSHFFTHKNYRPYSCDICGRKFRISTQMKNHHKMHTGEGLLQCKDCKDWFIDASYLKNQHSKYCKGGKVYQCQDCPRVFNDKKLFENHLGLHTGIRPFECTECGRAFPKEAVCNDHYKRHFQDFKFLCPQCNKGFQRMTDLRKHRKLHDKNHNYMRRYTLRDDLKPKPVVKDKIVTEEELDEATLLLTDEMTTSQTVVKEEFQTSGVPSTTIENANGEQVVTITTLPSGEMTFSHGGLSNESVIVVTIDPNVNLEEDS